MDKKVWKAVKRIFKVLWKAFLFWLFIVDVVAACCFFFDLQFAVRPATGVAFIVLVALLVVYAFLDLIVPDIIGNCIENITKGDTKIIIVSGVEKWSVTTSGADKDGQQKEADTK